MDGAVNASLKAHNIPGATVSLVRGDQLLFSKGYGYADIEKRKPVIANQTLFRVGSVSKLFIWTAVMQLSERGKLDLDADINIYLKDFQIPATYSQPITLKNLMTHTPGFEDLATDGRIFVRNSTDIMPLDLNVMLVIVKVNSPDGIRYFNSFLAESLKQSLYKFMSYFILLVIICGSHNHSKIDTKIPKFLIS